jgi:hypothetical protein
MGCTSKTMIATRLDLPDTEPTCVILGGMLANAIWDTLFPGRLRGLGKMAPPAEADRHDAIRPVTW